MLPIKISLPDNFLQEEIICEHTVSANQKKIWAVELDLLNELSNVCNRNNIPFYASCGTLLGAIRHGGFIPWDDDIDVMLFRHDYEKLCLKKDEFRAPYFFQIEETDPGSLRGHAQLRNSKTTAILKHDINRRVQFNQGIFIDILPLDGVPDNNIERNAFLKDLVKYRRNARVFSEIPAHIKDSPSRIKRMVKTLATPMLYYLGSKVGLERKYYDRWQKYMKKYNSTPYTKVVLSNFPECGERVIWNIEDFGQKTVNIDFEFMSIPVPEHFDNVLTKTYGNWHAFVKGKTSHGEIIFDTEKSYLDYLNK